jgi:glycosyltransferase involved in cell wall biosynthesis
VTSPEPFALLLPVYFGDRPEFLRDAFHSAVQKQTVRPDRVILVRDGPVSEELTRTIADLCAESPVPVDVVPIERSTGLGPALDAGLAASPYDIVARMDADDVAMPHRFEVQLPLIRGGADIVGAGLVEFEIDPSRPGRRRVPPTDPDDIRRFARIHDPFNHPTVIYRRKAVVSAGGYGDLPLMEDYWLFSRMLAAGARPMNVPEPLVYYRIGAGAYQRRGGRAQLRSELALQRRLRDGGLITRGQYVRNVIVRGGYRLLHWRLRRILYRLVVAGYGERRGRVNRSTHRSTHRSANASGSKPDGGTSRAPGDLPHRAPPQTVRGARNP